MSFVGCEASVGKRIGVGRESSLLAPLVDWWLRSWCSYLSTLPLLDLKVEFRRALFYFRTRPPVCSIPRAVVGILVPIEQESVDNSPQGYLAEIEKPAAFKILCILVP